MIVGNPERFAIEFELDKDHGGVWLFGRFCYWIANERIGDYELGTSLRDVLFSLDTIKNDTGNRVSMALFKLDVTQLFNRLNGALYSSGDTNFDKTIVIEETWARFNITLPVDIFDSWKIFLVETDEESRFIFKKIDTDDKQQHTHEVFLQKGEFDEAIIKCHKELDDLYNVELNIK